MGGQAARGGWRGAIASVLLLLLGCSFEGVTDARAEERAPRDPPASIRLAPLLTGYQVGGTLGFTLRDTAIAEQLYRRAEGSEPGLLWSAQFVSRWPLGEDQLDRWSAQAIGLLADGLGADVRLAGWEQLDAGDVGDRRVAYRYTLATPRGEHAGEATIVVFARGSQVGLAGAAAVGTRLPLDAAGLARMLDSHASDPAVVAQVGPRGSSAARCIAPRQADRLWEAPPTTTC